MNKQLLATIVFVLGRMDNAVLAFANIALHGRCPIIPPGNLAFGPLLEAHLINEDGAAIDNEILLEALSFEINHRLDEGTFALGDGV